MASDKKIRDLIRKSRKQHRSVERDIRLTSSDLRWAQNQHGTVVDPHTGEKGGYAVASTDDGGDNEIADLLAESVEGNKSRRWSVRAVFSFHRGEDGEMTLLKKVGVFTLLPPSPSPETERQLILMPHQQREEEMKRILESWKNVRERRYFFVEDRPPAESRLPRINRSMLIKLLLDMWRQHPVSTRGDIELLYPDGHVHIKLTREDLIVSSQREDLFSHVQRILSLMRGGFKYDGRVHLDSDRKGALRRVGPDKVWKTW